jgi:IS5 family transposase
VFCSRQVFPRLDQINNLDHALGRLAGTIDWRFLEERCGAVYSDGPGQPPLPTRLMAGLAILKHLHDLSDDDNLYDCQMASEAIEG